MTWFMWKEFTLWESIGYIGYANATHLMKLWTLQVEKCILIKSPHILVTALTRYEPRGWGNDIYKYTSNTASTNAMLIESLVCLWLILQIDLPRCITKLHQESDVVMLILDIFSQSIRHPHLGRTFCTIWIWPPAPRHQEGGDKGMSLSCNVYKHWLPGCHAGVEWARWLNAEDSPYIKWHHRSGYFSGNGWHLLHQ